MFARHVEAVPVDLLAGCTSIRAGLFDDLSCVLLAHVCQSGTKSEHRVVGQHIRHALLTFGRKSQPCTVGSLKVLDKELSRFLEDDGMTVAEVLVIWKRNFVGGFPTNSYLSPAVHPELVGKVTLINDCHDQLFLVALVQAVAVGAHLNNHSLFKLHPTIDLDKCACCAANVLNPELSIRIVDTSMVP